MFRWVNGKNPMQYGFDFGLWTRQIVRELIEQRFGVVLSLASVGALLARVGLTPQKPLQQAYQRDPQAVARWQRETYPAIARQAKREKADIYFWDESGFRADAVQGKTWGAKGQTPVVSVPGQRQSISAASAVSSKGAFWFVTYTGGLNGSLFIELLRKMMRGRRKPVHLIVDGLPAHKTKAVRDYVDELEGKLTLHFLPGYAPDLNPDELVWSYAKRTGNARRPLQAGEKLTERFTRRWPISHSGPHCCSRPLNARVPPVFLTYEQSTDADHHLAAVASTEQIDQCLWRILQAIDYFNRCL